MTNPIAVLIPAYNAEKIIQKALTSLGKNTEPHDIIVVDDGSHHVLQDAIKPQPNLTIIRTPYNVGITGALNYGLKYILQRDYKFIARLDADDEAAPTRLARQREFLEKNKDVLLVGSSGRVVSEQGKELFFLNHPTVHAAIMKKLNYNSCFLHPSLMIRAEALKHVGNYSPAYPSAEDYELIRRIAQHGRVANLPEYLINYTSSTGGISQSKRREQLKSRLKVQWAYRDFLNPHFYAGILKTLALWFMPTSLLSTIKQKLSGYRRR